MASVEKEILNWLKSSCKEGADIGYYDKSSELIKDTINNLINPLFEGILRLDILKEPNRICVKILDESRIDEVKTLCKLYV